MKYSVERIEENIVLCEDDDGNAVKMKLEDLPKGIREGDIIAKTDGGYTVDASETELRRRKMAELQKSVFGKRKK